jgi:hypothetical protein
MSIPLTIRDHMRLLCCALAWAISAVTLSQHGNHRPGFCQKSRQTHRSPVLVRGSGFAVSRPRAHKRTSGARDDMNPHEGRSMSRTSTRRPVVRAAVSMGRRDKSTEVSCRRHRPRPWRVHTRYADRSYGARPTTSRTSASASRRARWRSSLRRRTSDTSTGPAAEGDRQLVRAAHVLRGPAAYVEPRGRLANDGTPDIVVCDGSTTGDLV